MDEDLFTKEAFELNGGEASPERHKTSLASSKLTRHRHGPLPAGQLRVADGPSTAAVRDIRHPCPDEDARARIFLDNQDLILPMNLPDSSLDIAPTNTLHHKVSSSLREVDGKLRVAAIYNVRPPNLDLIRNENTDDAEIIETCIGSNLSERPRVLAADLALIYLDATSSPLDITSACKFLRAVARHFEKLIVIGDPVLLRDSETAACLVGHTFYDSGIDSETIRLLVRRNITFASDLRYKIAQFGFYIKHLNALIQSIVAQNSAKSPASLEHNSYDSEFHFNRNINVRKGDQGALSELALSVVGLLSGALNGEFTHIEYFQILMYLYRSAKAGQRSVPVSELCWLVGAPYSTTVRRIDELAKKDYARKEIDPNDKRRVNVEITARSTAIVENFIEKFRTSLQILT
ncbi:hypothetical protein KXS07_37165 [Inquilinus limosus]|uniref:MarR family winged helix-turn-helix transcriptional regulator n=1 Tax=Inquilinus limosus TaxID=171674 RepID=UPI003F15D9BB